MKHLLVDISAHGYGHIAQTAPVVNMLASLLPDLRVTVRSAAPLDHLRQRFSCDFQHQRIAIDFGMAMVDAVEVDVRRSLAAYRDYHADWAGKVERASNDMRELAPDLLLANVPYLSIAAAHAAQIPAVAMCCLNWADIYRHYAPDEPANREIHEQILAAYSSAQAFLQVQPAMPMPGLGNRREVACIAQLGQQRKSELRVRCGAQPAERLVLVAMGGIEYRLPMMRWPSIQGVRWLVPQAWGINRTDVSEVESLGMNFRDVLASCDAVLTKPGYGTFAEAACAGVPVLYVSRGDWPEAPFLVQWLVQNGVCLEVERTRLEQGELQSALQTLWAQSKPVPPANDGALQAATYLHRKLVGG